MSRKESEIINDSKDGQLIKTGNQGQPSSDNHSIEEAAIELSLYARYIWDIASALSKRELRNELLAVRKLTEILGETIERDS